MPELVEKRKENSKTSIMPNGSHALDISIGAIHYKDDYANESEQWKDIDLSWEGNRITKAPYELTLEGNKITVRDKKTSEVSTIELLEIGSKPIPAQAWEHSKGLAKAFDTDLEIIAENTAVRFARILKSDTAPKEAKYRVTGNIPLRVSAGDLEDELPVEWARKDGILTETLKPNRPIKYPARIDPTLEVRVDASGDDCMAYWDGDSWELGVGAASQLVGYDSATVNKVGGGMRFLDVALGNSYPIDTAYLILTVRLDRQNDDVNSKITGEDVDDAGIFTNIADYQARRGTIVGGANDDYITTAQVDWNTIAGWGVVDAEKNSPEIKTIIQEIIDRAGWASGNDLALFWDDHDDRSTHTNATIRLAWAYDSSTAKAPQLHIEHGVLHTLSLSDTVSIADTMAKGVGQALSDSVAVADSLSRVWTIKRALSDTVTIADSLARAWVAKLNLSDTVTIADSLAKTIGKPLSDTIAVADSLVKAIGIALSDSIAIADSLLRSIWRPIPLTLHKRFLNLTLKARSLALTLHKRIRNLTLRE